MDVVDGVLVLFDRLWFRRLILLPCPTPPEVESPVINGDSQDAESIASEPSSTISNPSALLLGRHRRSLSDDVPPSVDLQIVPKLHTILSGKVDSEAATRMSVSIEAGARRERERDPWGRRGRKGESKSLSDLEFQELKGFMDLGFTFSVAEASDPQLISIVPGLQRLRETAASVDEGYSTPCSSSAPEVAGGLAVVRPYLSEAWVVEERKQKGGDLLRNWRVPAASEEIDMKDHLRNWAHAVASAVR